MAYNEPFKTSEIIIGSEKNIISITDNGDMIFIDGSLDGTVYENGITLSDLANIENNVILDDLIDITDVETSKSYLLYRNVDNTWSAEEYTPPQVVVENLDDIQDVDVSSSSNNDVLTKVNGVWTGVPKSTTIIIQVESVDWTYNSTLLDGNPGYSVIVPHNLGLTLPEDLIDIGIWNTNNQLVTLHKVQQNSNNVYLESTVNLDLYVTMRKA